jgi:hypothetical protein
MTAFTLQGHVVQRAVAVKRERLMTSSLEEIGPEKDVPMDREVFRWSGTLAPACRPILILHTQCPHGVKPPENKS